MARPLRLLVKRGWYHVTELIQRGQHMDVGTRIGSKIVPFIRPDPGRIEKSTGRMLGILDPDDGLLNRRMAVSPFGIEVCRNAAVFEKTRTL